MNYSLSFSFLLLCMYFKYLSNLSFVMYFFSPVDFFVICIIWSLFISFVIFLLFILFSLCVLCSCVFSLSLYLTVWRVMKTFNLCIQHFPSSFFSEMTVSRIHHHSCRSSCSIFYVSVLACFGSCIYSQFFL